MTGSIVRGELPPPGAIAWLEVSPELADSRQQRARTGPIGLQIAPLPNGRGSYWFKGARLRGTRCMWSASTVRGAELYRPPRRLPPSSELPVQLLARVDCEGSVFEPVGEHAGGVLRVVEPGQELREQFRANTHLFTLTVHASGVGVDPVTVAEMTGRRYPLSSLQVQLLRSATDLLRVRPAEFGSPNTLVGIDRYLAALAGLLLRTAVPEPGADAAQLESVRQRTDAIILDQFADPMLSPSRIAEQLSISLRQLYRAFDGTQSPAARIRRCRLNRAAEMLAERSIQAQVERIAQDCGFTSAEYFSRAFRREFGVSPRAYRSARRNGRQTT
jgi:AraC-like DNA-binding protein